MFSKARKRFPTDGKMSNIKNVPSEIALSCTAGHSDQNSGHPSLGAYTKPLRCWSRFFATFWPVKRPSCIGPKFVIGLLAVSVGIVKLPAKPGLVLEKNTPPRYQQDERAEEEG